MLGWGPAGPVVLHGGEGASLALFGHSSSDACFSLTYWPISADFF